MKNLVILGSTGSIGQSTLDIVRRFPNKFRVVGLSTNRRIEALEQQIKEFRPERVCVRDPQCAWTLEPRIKKGTLLYTGDEGLLQLVTRRSVDEVVVAISGSEALAPLVAALKSRKGIVLANKESLVMAGPIIMALARDANVRIKPVDSEQSAIWQCLESQDRRTLRHIYLTASGGPFRRKRLAQLKKIAVGDALCHPRWKMGKKVTIDSATLMNKGLELFEAMYLFGAKAEEVRVIIHPEAIIHSMVEFIDGVIMAQLSITDMRIPIQYALTYPQRLRVDSLATVDFVKLAHLSFERPDLGRFPCLRLAYEAAREGGTTPCVLNAANEVGVDAFLKQGLDFMAIPRVVEKVLQRHHKKNSPDLKDILNADAWARQEAMGVVEALKN